MKNYLLFSFFFVVVFGTKAEDVDGAQLPDDVIYGEKETGMIWWSLK